MINNHPYYLFVYGTLRNGIDVPVKEAMANNIEWMGTSEIKGKLYDIGDYQAALPLKKDEKSTIKGEVLKVNNPDIIKVLDEYEGYNPKALKESEYYREKEKVSLQDGTEINAWVYCYDFPVEGKRHIRHKDYLNYLKTKKTA